LHGFEVYTNRYASTDSQTNVLEPDSGRESDSYADQVKRNVNMSIYHNRVTNSDVNNVNIMVTMSYNAPRAY